MPGKIKLWKPQRQIVEAIGNRLIPRVTVMKSARVGYTKSVMGDIAYKVANRPGTIILLEPTEDDCRHASIDEVSPMFQESPALSDLLTNQGMGWSGEGDRDTLKEKLFPGGSLKILPARSPRNLRHHDCKYLYMDEVDEYEITAQGDPILLVERRTWAHDDRKIVMGSTPTEDGISTVQRYYKQSDQRIYEVPCPHCGKAFEMLWEQMHWPKNKPEAAHLVCPLCDQAIDEKFKRDMVEAGNFRPTMPEVEGHAGFRINALSSLFENAKWGILAKEYVEAKRGGPAMMQAFDNTVLGKPSRRDIDSVDQSGLQAKVEEFNLRDIPQDVLLITCGVDVQNDRLEATLLGWDEPNQPYVLGHFVFWGITCDDPVWQELDNFLQRRWLHPLGGMISIGATAIDSGGTGQGPESRTQKVYDFTANKLHRHIYAIKGEAGNGPVWRRSKSEKAVLFLIKVDLVKLEVLERLAALPYLDESGEPSESDKGCGRNELAFRISDSLTDEWFEQVTNEKRFSRYVHNRRLSEFRPITPGARVEALDCLVYAMAVRAQCGAIAPRRAKLMAPPKPAGAKKRSMLDFARLQS